MKRILLFFCVMLFSILGVNAQELEKAAATQLVEKNLVGIGLKPQDLADLKVSNAYHNRTAGTDLVYMQQQQKGIPILNQLLVLAFKNGKLVSRAGTMYRGFEKLPAATVSETPSVPAEMAAIKAMAAKQILPKGSLNPTAISSGKMDFGKAGVASENITAELMWEIDEKSNAPKLVWQVYFVPKTTSDYWLIRVNAHDNSIVSEHNLTVYCNWDDPDHKNATTHNHGDIAQSNPSINTSSLTGTVEDPEIVNGASYRVVPFPAESPIHAGGAHALRTDPWTAAPGNATSLKWHSDGTDYTYTRGNNVWAYHDRTNTNSPSVANAVASTTTPDPLTFNFTPNYLLDPTQTTPNPNQQFNITNLFYWNNVIHDVLYQYGFDEPGGNFQQNNQGRGGAGNDYVMAEAQDGSGTNNANFATPADGGRPRMQMYLWDGPPKLVVNTPASIAGNYRCIEGGFSTANLLINLGPRTGQVVYYNDDAAGNTHYACGAPANSITGKIALIIRGAGTSGPCASVNFPAGIPFTQKVLNAQNAGAIAVIMVNNVPGDPIIMGGTDNTITIPAVMISDVDGAILAAQLANNLNVTLNPPVQLDGDVDNGVVVHEFGHGISNRLAGGPAQAGCVSNAEHMGEGWSDYFCLMLTQDWAASNVNTGFTSPRGIGTYAAGQSANGIGIRSQRYSTDFSVNNLVYTASLPGTGLQHTRGELWAATLWDMTWNIIQQTNSITPSIYNGTGTGGNVIALRLVMEGLKLQPCNSGFIDGRDAILRADEILYNGAYSCAIREAFRRRGMGAFALQGSANSVTDQVPDFSSTVSVKLTSSVTEVPEGQNVTYTNTVVSCGPVTNYVLRDTLPTNVTYVAGSGGVYDAATRVVSFAINFTAAGTQTHSFTVTANTGSYYATTTYLNEVVAAPSIPATLTQTSTTATVWTGTNTQSHSAPNSLFSPNSATPSDQILRTANPIALGTNQSALSFWHKYDTEAGYDGGVVEISTDGGTNWTDLDTKMILGYYNGVIDPTAGTPIQGRKAYTGSVASFIKTDINLSSYAGQSAHFRWRFNSDNGTAVTGWFVDDILVKNEPVINIRTSLFSSTGTILQYVDTVTRILQNTVCTNIAITTPPASQTVCAGANVTFTVAVTGSSPAYQWQISTNGGGLWTNISGQTNATLTLTAVTGAMSGNQYRVIVNNNCPSSATSAAATLTVTTASSITTQPTSTTVCANTNATFTVVAAGPAITYQWQVSTNGGSTWTNMAGQTSATLTLTAVTAAMNGNQYRVVISTCAPGGLTSNAVTLTVNASAVITTQPASTVACTGNTATFSVTATGTSLTYQWQVSTDGGTTWNNISGQTAATLSIAGVTAALNNNQYRVVINGNCTPGGLNSSAATLTVNNSIVISQQPQSVTLCAGLNASFSVTASGSGLTYQWQVSTDGGTTWTNIAAATSSTLTLTSVQPSMNNNRYRAVLNGACVSNFNSDPATLTVNSSVTITTQPTNQVGCAPAPAAFSVTATGTSLTYQWQVSTDGGATYTNIAGATTPTYNIASLTPALNGNRYRVIVTGSPCGSVTSSAATLTIGQLPTVTVTANPTTITPTQTATLTANVTPAGTYTYQWFRNGVAIAGETNQTLLVGFSDNDVYTVTAFNSNGCSNTSAGFSLTYGPSGIAFIYPSPNNGFFHVRYYSQPGANPVRVLNVYDAKGARVFTKPYNINAPYYDMQVDIRNAAAGIYMVELLDRNGSRIAGGKVYKF
jgi:extracellular elastinolytic metalloproteinase